MSKRDYYEVLGVGKNASPDEIKKAFRRAAVEHHPDRGGDEEKFKELNEAYEVLKDSSKRQRYDQFGHAGVGGASGGGNPYQGFGGGGQQRQQGRQARGHDVETRVEVTFEQAIFGTEVDLQLNIEDVCDHCKGTTAEPGFELKACPQCKGSGQVVTVAQTIFGNIQQAAICPTCRGRGKIPEKTCSVCNGRGTRKKNQAITLKIPAGIDDGATIRLREHGEAVANGVKGDLYVNVRVKAHKKFSREGDLILSEEHVHMVDAALGVEIEVETVDGPIRMKVPAGTQSGSDFKLSNHGVPHIRGNTRGAHIVTIVVDTPTKLTKRQKELLAEFQKDSGKKSIFGL